MSAAAPAERAARSIEAVGWAFAAVAVVVRIVFWRHTGRVWEDSLITILHAENALDGIGLTHYKPDEGPIHGFTSPLGVLIPLAGEWLHRGWALDAIRVVSLITAFISVRLAARIAIAIPALGLTPPLAALACGYLALEHHQVLWGMAGMETQLVVCLLLWSIVCLATRRDLALGVSLGLCLWARPDMALWAAIVGVVLLVRARAERRWRPLAMVVGVAVLVYLPWIVFAWSYYGSPVPNTILAKSAGFAYWWQRDSSLAFWLAGAGYHTWVSILAPLGPAFAGNGTNFVKLFDPGFLAGAMTLMILVGFAASCRRAVAAEVRVLYAFFWVFLAYFVFLVPAFFGWYVVPFMAVCVILAAHGIGALLARVPRLAPRAGIAVAAVYLAAIAGILPLTFHGERNIQRLVEQPVRIAIGEYLRASSPPTATAGGEPLGFVGYYSRRAYYDYPGLASRRVVDFLRASGKRSLYAMLMHFHPDYLVLRDFEIDGFGADRPWLDRNYRVDRRFSVSESDRAKLLHGERNIDLAYTVFKRRDAP